MFIQNLSKSTHTMLYISQDQRHSIRLSHTTNRSDISMACRHLQLARVKHPQPLRRRISHPVLLQLLHLPLPNKLRLSPSLNERPNSSISYPALLFSKSASSLSRSIHSHAFDLGLLTPLNLCFISWAFILGRSWSLGTRPFCSMSPSWRACVEFALFCIAATGLAVEPDRITTRDRKVE